MRKDYLKRVKELVSDLLYKDFNFCYVRVYVEPSISSIVFVIKLEGCGHIFKVPFALFESDLSPEALADIIVNEVKEWKDKF